MVPPIKGSFEVEIKTDKQAESLVEDLNEKEAIRLLDALNKKLGKKEKKETIENLPELDKENFRVKDKTGWTETVDPNGVKVLVNLEGDIREYLEGDKKGEQLFTLDSAKREADKAGKRLPKSWTTYRDIIEKKYEGDYQKFLEGENMKFCGWRGPDDKGFKNIGNGFSMWCGDGSSFDGGRDRWGRSDWSRDYGFSVRCLKD